MPITEEEKRKYAWEKARKVEGFDDTLFSERCLRRMDHVG